MRAHGKQGIGQILRGTDRVSTRVIRTFCASLSPPPLLCELRQREQEPQLYTSLHADRHASWQVQQLQKSLTSIREAQLELRAPILTDPRSAPLTLTLIQEPIRKLIWGQLQHSKPWLALSCFSSVRTYCRRCCCGNAAPLNDSPTRKTQKRGNTHSSVSPGILNLSRWAFMAALDSIDLLCTWYFFSQNLAPRQTGTENGWSWLFFSSPCP